MSENPLVCHHYSNYAYDVYAVSLNTAWNTYQAAGLKPLGIAGNNAPDYKNAKRPVCKGWHSSTLPAAAGGIALATGRLADGSGHIVLDLDAPDIAASLSETLPATWQVKTRRGCHLHYRIPANLKLPRTRHAAGKYDLLSSGAYAIAPPTTWQVERWQTITGGPQSIHTLTAAELRGILDILDTLAPQSKSEPAPVSSTLADTLTLYRKHRGAGKGRNVALFQAVCITGSAGPDLQAAFVLDLPDGDHVPESPATRTAEFLRTVASARRAAARPGKPGQKSELRFDVIPNALRERLLQKDPDGSDYAIALRTLEALHHCGYRAGDTFTVNELAAKVPLSANVIRDGLQQLNRLLEKHGNTVVQPLVVVGKFRQLLGIEALCELLEVESKGGDALPIEAIQSAKTYRMALLQAILYRAPGRWSAAHLGAILGVSPRCIRTYLHEIGAVSVAQVERRALPLAAVATLPKEHPGRDRRFWLETSDGSPHIHTRGNAVTLYRPRAKGGRGLACRERPLYQVEQLASYRTMCPDEIPAWVWDAAPER